MTELRQEQKPSAPETKNAMTIKSFQEGIREGKIEGYKCLDCSHKQIDIINFCPVCHGSNLQKIEFQGEGRVVTYTIQYVAPEQFLNEVPYAWAVIDLDDGPRITGWIPFISKSEDLPVGQKVRFKKSYLPGIVFEKL